MRKMTITSVEARNHCCQRSESILVMINTPMNSVAMRASAPSSLVFRRNRWPYSTFSMTKVALGRLLEIAKYEVNSFCSLVCSVWGEVSTSTAEFYL